MKRIGFYLGDTNLSAGGVAPYALRVAAALDERASERVAVTMIVSGGGVAMRSLATAKAPRNHWLRKAMFHASDMVYLATHPRAPGRMSPYRGWLSRIHCDLRRYDLLHIPYQIPPRLTFRCPFIVTMHDVQELHFPEFFTPRERLLRADRYLAAIEQSARVVVSFDHVKDDLLKYFGCPPDKVVVIPVPYSQCMMPTILPELDAVYRAKYQDFGPFFMYPAQTWEHKNHLRLIDAFERVCNRSATKVELVCSGNKNDHYRLRIEPRVVASPVRDRIHFLGLLPIEELSWLYRNCLCVVVPSLYEAGSFPLMEAMQLHLPVVCAATTSLPQTIGDAQFVFDPRDVQAMADIMVRMLEQSSFREEGMRNSAARTESWQHQATADAYETLWIETLDRESSRT